MRISEKSCFPSPAIVTDHLSVSIDKFELSTGWSASQPIEVKIVKPVQKTITVIFNWLNPDSTTATDTAKLTAENNLAPVPTVVSPDGKKFVGWHQDVYKGGTDLPANTATISYDELDELLEGETGTDLYVTFTAKYEDTLPKINIPDGYYLKGWTVNGQESESWSADTKTVNLGEKYYFDPDDQNGTGMIAITALLEKKPSSGDSDSDSSSSSDNNSNNNNSNSNNNNTKTVSSNNNQVVKADAPADNTAKIMPQTGLSVETPVVFGVMMVAALAGAGAYLFAIRKKLN